MARYLNPNLMMTDGDMGDIPSLADALNTFINSAGENVPPSKTATDTATVTPTVTPTYTASELADIQRKVASRIPLNDYEQEILSAYQTTGNTASADGNAGGSNNTGGDNTGGDNNNNPEFPQGVDGFTQKDGLLYENGKLYSGEFDGKVYENGKVKTTPPPGGDGGDGEDKYEIINGVLNKNGEPYSGTYEGKEYENGKVKVVKSDDKYETVDGVFTKNGDPYTGNYNGKSYKDGVEIVTPENGKTSIDAAAAAATAAVTAQVEALTAQIAELVKLQTDSAAKAAEDAKKPKVVGVRTVRKTGGVVETVEVMSDGSPGRVIDSYKDYGASESVMRMFQNLGLGEELIKSMTNAIDRVYEDNVMPTEDQILNAIYTSDAYNTRFAANKVIRERMASGKGLPGDKVLTPQEYIQTERTYKQYMESAGLPTDFYNELNDFTNLIANAVSPDELKDRVTIAKNVLQTADENVKKALKDYYGLTDADMVAYLLDKDKAFRAIDKRFVYSTPEAEKMYTATEVGGAALRAGIAGGATKKFAEEITTAGKAGQAEEAFQTTARNQQDYARLMGLYGEQAGQEDLTRQQLALAGGTEVALKTKKLASKERAKFSQRSAIDRTSLSRRLSNPDV